MLKADTERSVSFSLKWKFLDFIDAVLKNQVIGLQLPKEIELYPEISVITRYWNIKLVNDNKAWIPRLIIAAWTHTSAKFHLNISNSVVDFKFKTILLYLQALDVRITRVPV